MPKIRPVIFPNKGPKPRPNEDRFWAKVQKTDSCWLWLGSKVFYRHPNGTTYGGYGVFGVRTPGIRGHQNTLAHRFAWTMTHGPIPAGLDVLHSCDQPKCVRPDHLRVGTASENSRDMVAKHRHGKHTKPESWNPDRHWTRAHPERVRRGRDANRGSAKITLQRVLEIRRSKESNAVLGQRFGVLANTIYRIRSGRTWDFPEAYPRPGVEKPDINDD